jgi:hypothetical protein
LARSFWYYGKKRGHRRSGSPALASAGEALFFAMFLLLGCGGALLMLSRLVLPEWQVNHEFVETTCRVLDKRIAEMQGEDGPLYRSEFYIKYEVGVATYGDWHYDIHRDYSSSRKDAEAVLDRFAIYDRAKDNRYPCWYDPASPNIAVLVREYRWWVWLAFTVPLSFLVIGAGGLVYTVLHWGKSAERRALIAQRAQARDLFGPNGDGHRSYPFVPQGADLTNSPGTRLRFRLPMAGSTGWALFGALALCVAWNSIVAVLVVIAFRSHDGSWLGWFRMVLLAPPVLIGLATIAFFIRKLLAATGVGPTLVEISDHPLIPGGQVHLFLSQSGRLTVNALRVWLVCEESATYRQGTNARTETKEVYRGEEFSRETFRIESGLPFEAEFDVNVPEGAMHSFKAAHNDISWFLSVEADLANRPNYRRSFPLVIRPAGGESDR